MSEPVVIESRSRKLSAIWVVPVVAVLLGLWLAVDAYLKQGPTITLDFETAEGIQAGKTLVKTRNVTVGTVTKVRLNDDLDGVSITAELIPEATALLREDTQFWVMKAEVRGASVSGIGTLLSGAYVEVSPGIGKLTRNRAFKGLDRRPASPVGTPGKHLKLVSASSGSVQVGSPILYRGYPVGTVEQIELEVDTQRVMYSIFVDAPYDELVSNNTRFWNASGISAELSTEGVKLSIGSLQSALMGGVAFDLPLNTDFGRAVSEGTLFRLYPDEASIHENPFDYWKEYVVFFEQSLRGLNPGAPVSYRGIRIGSVMRIMLEDLSASANIEGSQRPIPVLIRLEPGRLSFEDSPAGALLMEESVAVAVEQGMRATLASGNIITGARLIELDFHSTERAESLGDFLGYPMIPVINGGLAHIQEQVTQLLEKLNNLPLEGVLVRAESAVVELEGTLLAFRQVAESEALQELPASVGQTLNRLDDVLAGFDSQSDFQRELVRAITQLKEALRSIDSVADQLNEKPNALVFPMKATEDLQPRVTP